jgi:hypothetical protein
VEVQLAVGELSSGERAASWDGEKRRDYGMGGGKTEITPRNSTKKEGGGGIGSGMGCSIASCVGKRDWVLWLG